MIVDPVNSRWLYGGVEYALKSAGHELKGIISLMDVLLDSPVHFPLMCVIDYGGFRIVASAELPLSSKTLVYVRILVNTVSYMALRVPTMVAKLFTLATLNYIPL